MGIFGVDYTHVPFFSVKSLDSFGGQPNDANEEKEFFYFQSRRQFSFCIH